MEKKAIGIGISDFKSIIEKNCYYFDKTSWIEELIKDGAAVKLFTRPRRFENSDVYNPWSIIKFLSTRKLEAHWVETRIYNRI